MKKQRRKKKEKKEKRTYSDLIVQEREGHLIVGWKGGVKRSRDPDFCWLREPCQGALVEAGLLLLEVFQHAVVNLPQVIFKGEVSVSEKPGIAGVIKGLVKGFQALIG